MVEILLLSNGNLCEGILQSAQVVLGDCDRIKAIPVQADDNIDDFSKKVESAVNEMDDGGGVLILVDILGGTPFNKSALLLRGNKITIVTGLNLPMLFAAIEGRYQDLPLNELAENCKKEGISGIKSTRDFLKDSDF